MSSKSSIELNQTSCWLYSCAQIFTGLGCCLGNWPHQKTVSYTNMTTESFIQMMTGYSSMLPSKRNSTCANSDLSFVFEHWIGNRERICHVSYKHISDKELLNILYFKEESTSVQKYWDYMRDCLRQQFFYFIQ